MTGPAPGLALLAARRLLAGQHQPAAMSHHELWVLLAKYQKALNEVVEALDTAPASE